MCPAHQSAVVSIEVDTKSKALISRARLRVHPDQASPLHTAAPAEHKRVALQKPGWSQGILEIAPAGSVVQCAQNVHLTAYNTEHPTR